MYSNIFLEKIRIFLIDIVLFLTIVLFYYRKVKQYERIPKRFSQRLKICYYFRNIILIVMHY